MEHDIFTLFGTGRARQFLVGNFLKIKRLEAFIDHTKDVISITVSLSLVGLFLID